jgi:hypothetical protein
MIGLPGFFTEHHRVDETITRSKSCQYHLKDWPNFSRSFPRIQRTHRSGVASLCGWQCCNERLSGSDLSFIISGVPGQNIRTAEKKLKNGRVIPIGPSSYGHAAKVLDISAKVFVYYCGLPAPDGAKVRRYRN